MFAGVFGGLLIILLSVLVLQTINPAITSLGFFSTLKEKVAGTIPPAPSPDPVQYCFKYLGGLGGSSTTLCSNTERECNEVRAATGGGVKILTPCALGSGGTVVQQTHCFTNTAFTPPGVTCGGTIQSCNDRRDELIFLGADFLTPCAPS